MTRLSIALLCIVVGMSGFGLGLAVAALSDRVAPERSSLEQAIAGLRPGDRLVLHEEVGPTGTFDKSSAYQGPRWFARFLSWAGLGGPEAAVQAPGLKLDGAEVGVPTYTGPGFWSRAWATAKRLFWIAVIVFVVYLVCSVLTFVHPAFGVVAKVIAGVCTLGLSLILSLADWIGKLRATKALKETATGIDAYRATLPPEQDAALVARLTDAQKTERATVRAARKTNK